jgi:hypothetical protein
MFVRHQHATASACSVRWESRSGQGLHTVDHPRQVAESKMVHEVSWWWLPNLPAANHRCAYIYLSGIIGFPLPAAPSPLETILWIPCSIIICVCSVCSWKIVYGLILIFRLSGSRYCSTNWWILNFLYRHTLGQPLYGQLALLIYC